MIINHNIVALNTLNHLNAATNAQSKAMQKLSSGLRINSAADDAAGLAISEKMRSQIRGLDQATKNAQDAISLLQTAEGALNETHDILQRMRELAVQSSNDTNTDSDRKEIQKEINQLKDEVNRISTDTEFNTKKLLNGSVGNTATVGTNKHVLKNVEVADSNLASDTYSVKTANAATVGADVKTNTTGLAADDFDLNTDANIDGLKLGNYTLETKSTGTADHFDVTLKDENGTTVASLNNWDTSGTGTLTGKLPDGTSTKFTIKQPTGTVTEGSMEFNLNATYANDADFQITNSKDGTEYSSAASLKITDNEFEAGGLKFDLSVDTVLAAAGTSTVKTTNNALTMHIGANEDQTMKVDINKMDIQSLGIKDIDVTTQKGAESAITALNDAITNVSAERSKLGAFQNRLEHSINNLNTSSENLTSAESRIRDVDYALAA